MKRWLLSQWHAWVSLHKHTKAGYTLVEVTIVLAVSSALFVAVAVSFSGRQARVAFNQAVRSFESELLNLSGDVTNGFYSNGFTCNASGNGPPTPTSSATAPGTNTNCIFVGKMWVSGTSQSEILTVVGRQYIDGSSKRDVTTLAEAQPRVFESGSGGANITESYSYGFGLEILKVYINDGSLIESAAFGFFNQLSGGVSVSASSSGKTVLLYGLPASTVPAAKNNAINRVHTLNNVVPLPNGVIICVRGGNNQRAEIKLGENGTQTGISVEIDITSGPCFNA